MISPQLEKKLGIEFDGKRKLKPHLQTTTRKCYRIIGFVFRTIKRFKNPELIILFGIDRTITVLCGIRNTTKVRQLKKKTRMLYYRL